MGAYRQPVMDGLSATRAIRSAEAAEGRAPTPVVGLTANAMPDDVGRCLNVGMNAHVAKPIDWATLFATINRLARVPRSDAVSGGTAANGSVDVLDHGSAETALFSDGSTRVSNTGRAFACSVPLLQA